MLWAARRMVEADVSANAVAGMLATFVSIFLRILIASVVSGKHAEQRKTGLTRAVSLSIG
jgi:hypothetical protein